MTEQEILGFHVGMSLDQARRVVATLTGVRDCEEKTVWSTLHPEEKRVRAVYVNFEDDRFLNIGLAETKDGTRVAEVSLVYQDASFSKDLVQKVVERYGPPDFRRKRKNVLKMAWGGRAESEGAISPYKGVKTTLLLEETNNRLVTLTLTGHDILKGQL